MPVGEVERSKLFQEMNKDPDSKNGEWQYKKLSISRVETHNCPQLPLPINDYSYYAEKEASRVAIFLPYAISGALTLILHNAFEKRLKNHPRILPNDT